MHGIYSWLSTGYIAEYLEPSCLRPSPIGGKSLILRETLRSSHNWARNSIYLCQSKACLPLSGARIIPLIAYDILIKPFSQKTVNAGGLSSNKVWLFPFFSLCPLELSLTRPVNKTMRSANKALSVMNVASVANHRLFFVCGLPTL